MRGVDATSGVVTADEHGVNQFDERDADRVELDAGHGGLRAAGSAQGIARRFWMYFGQLGNDSCTPMGIARASIEATVPLMRNRLR